MKRSISPILKLSGKPISAVKEKKFLDENDRKGFIRDLRKLDRWVKSILGRG